MIEKCMRKMKEEFKAMVRNKIEVARKYCIITFMMEKAFSKIFRNNNFE